LKHLLPISMIFQNRNSRTHNIEQLINNITNPFSHFVGSINLP
jgi:hypothetical protein